jgi:hypothetical protein
MKRTTLAQGSTALLAAVGTLLSASPAVAHDGATGATKVIKDGYHTLFGAAPYPGALDDADSRFGPLDMIRIFVPTGRPPAWNSSDARLPANNGNRPVYISFKFDQNAAEAARQVLSGEHDAYMSNWFATAPTNVDVYWGFFHEPEDNFDTATLQTQYRAAYQHLDELANAAQANNPRLHTTWTMMSWSHQIKSDGTFVRNVENWYPGSGVVDVQAWDNYLYIYEDTCEYKSMAYHEQLMPVRQFAESKGDRFAVAEIGAPEKTCPNGASSLTGRPQWLRDVGQWYRGKAEFVAYWLGNPGGTFDLNDAASAAAWDDVVDGDEFVETVPTVDAYDVPAGNTSGPPVDVTRKTARVRCGFDGYSKAVTVWTQTWVVGQYSSTFANHTAVTVSAGDANGLWRYGHSVPTENLPVGTHMRADCRIQLPNGSLVTADQFYDWTVPAT